MNDEKEILNRCIERDRKAQRLLYETYAPALLAILVRFTGNREEAEDLLQDGFVKIFNNLKHFEARSSLFSWMRRIMINTAISSFHRTRKHRYHSDIDELEERYPGQDGWKEAEFTGEELLQVIGELPDGYRMVFNLYALEGYRHREIAREMGIDVNTSKSQYSRAKRLIRHKLAVLKKEAEPRHE